MRFLSIAALALLTAACGQDEVAEGNAQGPAAQPEAPMAQPQDDPADPVGSDNGTEPAGGETNTADPAPATLIPAAFRGRWGINANDCDPARADNKGLVTISEDRMRFYESVGRPTSLTVGAGRIEGDFAFTGEGMTWTRQMRWTIDGETLERVDGDGTELTYTRC